MLEICSSVPSSVLQPLLTKQKAAIRIIANKKYNDHTEAILKALSILPFPDLITTVGGLETETCKHCTGDSPFKDTVLLIVSPERVVSWAACASWNTRYPF
jgi:hypothetical protein